MIRITIFLLTFVNLTFFYVCWLIFFIFFKPLLQRRGRYIVLPLSICLSFCSHLKFLSHFSQQLLITDAGILTHFLFRHAIFVPIKCQFPVKWQIIYFWPKILNKILSKIYMYLLHIFETLTHSLLSIPYDGIHFCTNWVSNFCKMTTFFFQPKYSDFLSKFSQQLFIADVWNCNTLYLGMLFGGIYYCINRKSTSC